MRFQRALIKHRADSAEGSGMQISRTADRRPKPGLLRSAVGRVRRLFASRLRFVRTGLNVEITLDRGPQQPAKATGPAPKPRVPEAAQGADPIAMELRQIGKELQQRLDRHALSRTVFDKLAIVERELARRGYSALDALSVELLHTALEQLGCVIGPRPGELGTLRAKMVDALLARRSKSGDFSGNLALSTFDVPHKLEVREAGESSFFDAQRQWVAQGTTR